MKFAASALLVLGLVALSQGSPAPLLRGVGRVLGGVSSGVGGVLNGVGRGAAGIVQGVATADIGAIAGGVSSAVEGAVGGVVATVDGAVGGVSEVVEDVGGAVTGSIGGGQAQAVEALNNAAGAVQAAAAQPIQGPQIIINQSQASEIDE